MNEKNSSSTSSPLPEEDRLLIERGLVPERSWGPFGSTSEWHKPRSPGIEWPTASVLISILAFILLIVWGPPW